MSISSASKEAASEWPALEALKASFDAFRELPYCSGSVPLQSASSKVFYLASNKMGFIDFTSTSDAQLSELANACEPASFGRNGEDVMDESYRRAGKLDVADFSAQFCPSTYGVLDMVQAALLRGENSEKNVKAELYKLNVYGPGSFFKSHVDTPRSDTMFASLVVVLPTIHEGGSLICRHKDQEFIFDTAKAVQAAAQTGPQIAFVAFFSDVEHEVSPVTAGYRVTLTYNLYLVDQTPTSSRQPELVPKNDPLSDLRASLSTLLSDPEFLPKGGLFGFQLSHKYPFKTRTTNVESLEKRLKGTDATLKGICQEIGLSVSLKAMYAFKEKYGSDFVALVDSFVDLHQWDYQDANLAGFFTEVNEATLVYNFFPGLESKHEEWDEFSCAPIVWIQKDKSPNGFEETYIAYGNEADLDHMYGDICLVAEVKPFAERVTTV